MTPLIIALSLGCWKTDFVDPSYEVVPFTHPDLETSSAVVEKITTDLPCPDDQDAIFYVAYDPEAEPGPPVVLLHSSAFDYVLYPSADDPLKGTHYAASDPAGDHRLSGNWAIKKVWETLGVYPRIEGTEVNEGAMPAALLNRGAVVFMPGNCWGDLWHNEEILQSNAFESDLFWRNGRTFAAWMLRVIEEGQPSFVNNESVGYAESIAPGDFHLVGLGDGARGVIELLRRLQQEGDAMPASALMDAPVDDLVSWEAALSGRSLGLERLFWDTADVPGFGYWSLAALASEGALAGVRTAVVFSSIDPQVPSQNLNGLLAALSDDDDTCVIDTNASAHVFTNGDGTLARQVTNFTINGEAANECNNVALGGYAGGGGGDTGKDTGGGGGDGGGFGRDTANDTGGGGFGGGFGDDTGG